MAKTTIISLTRDFDGQAMDFEVGHAENILRMKNSGWSLPKDSEYEYKDGTIIPRDKGKNK